MKSTTTTLFLATLPFISAAPAQNHGGNGYQHPGHSQGQGLHALATEAGLLYFGTAIDNVVLNNTRYTSIAYNNSEFGQVTPANGQKWMFIEPSHGVFNYTMGDEIIKPAKAHDQIRRCHNFVWHNQLPDWLTSRNWTKSELTEILENHIKHEATYYKNDCYAWDVVNEALDEDGTYRKDIWLNTIGPEYIELAFQFAKKYVGHGTKLYYNDYGIETVGNKSTAALTLVKELQRKGVPIDGVGFQSHFHTNSTPTYARLTENFKRFTALGLDIAITELDVRTNLPDSAALQAQQAKDYATSVKACVDTENCVGVTVWDFWDPVSWVPYTFPGQGNADLWADDFTKKPAYYAVADVFKNAAKDGGH